MGKFKGKDKGKASKPRVSALGAAAAKSEVQGDREPKFDEGTWRVTFRECEQPPPPPGKHAWLVIRLTGAGDDEGIGDRAAPMCISSKSLASTGPRVKSLCMALIGMGKDEEADYNEFDPHGEFIDAIADNDLKAAAAYYAKRSEGKISAKDALEALTTTEFLAVATLGGEADDGTRYVNVSFKPAPEAADSEDEDEDEDSDEDEDDEDEAPESEPPAKVKAKGKRKPAPVEEDEDEDEDEDDEEPESEPAPRAKKKAKRRK